MTTKKILITGLGDAATEEGILAWLSHFGPIQRVVIVREGNPDDPLVLLEMAIGDGAAGYLLSHLNDYWHEGRLVSARLLHH